MFHNLSRTVVLSFRDTDVELLHQNLNIIPHTYITTVVKPTRYLVTRVDERLQVAHGCEFG